MHERIKIVRQTYALSMQAFGDRLGVSASSVAKLESGVNNPSERTIRAICSEFNIRRDWLETGEGDMYAPIADDNAIGVIGRRMLDDPERTGRLIRAIAAMGDDAWYILVSKIDELLSLYKDTEPPDVDADPEE